MAFKLNYFDARGIVEPLRYMFAVSKTPYEDKRFSLTFGVPGDFSTLSRPEFDAAKAAGDLDPALGRLPVLEYDGVKMGQSKAIERFVAKKVGMMGASDVEAALIDVMCENIRDAKDMYMKAKTDDEKKAEYFSTKMPEFLQKVEKTCAAPGPWLVGSKVSLADAAMYVFIKEFFDNKEGAWAACAACPKIMASIETFNELPEVTAWQSARPDTMF